MSQWAHLVCSRCYEELYPTRAPVSLKEPKDEICCRCGELTASGIYVRANPEEMKYCNHKEEN